MKKIYVILGVLLVGMFAMAYLYFSNLSIETSANDVSLTAAANNAGIVFSFDNDKSFYEILSSQELFQNILGKSKSKTFKALRDNLIAQPEISSALDGQKVYIGFSSNENEVDYLISTQLKSNTDVKKILSSLDSKNITTKKTGNTYELTFTDSSHVFIGVDNHLVLISNEFKTIQSAKKPAVIDQKFIDYIKTNSRFNKNLLANLFINYNQLPNLLKGILSSNLTGELSIFNKQDSYASFSYNFSKEKLLFNGTTDVNNVNSYQALFANLTPQKIGIDNILPNTTANYVIYHTNDYKNWYKSLNNWFINKKESDKIAQAIAGIDQKYRIELKQTLPKYFKDQFITFQLASGEKFGAVALNNGEKVNQFLLDLSSDYASDVKILREAGIPYYFFGEPLKKFDRPFYTIIDNYLVMANNASSIQVFLAKYKSNSLLVNDEDYIAFHDQISSSATILYYINHKNSNDIFGRNLKAPYYKQYQLKSGLKDYSSFSYQLSGDHGKFLSNLLLYKKQKSAAIDPLDTTTN